MAQRISISRAKQSIKTSGVPFAMPDGPERAERLRVLHLIFNEGYTATTGPDLTAPQLSDEAIRLTGWLRRLLPDDGEVTGLLALMLRGTAGCERPESGVESHEALAAVRRHGLVGQSYFVT